MERWTSAIRHAHAFIRSMHSQDREADAAAGAPSFDVKPYEKLLPNCSWQISVTPVSFPGLPEWSCIYQSTVLRQLTTTRHVKITGACTISPLVAQSIDWMLVHVSKLAHIR